MPTFINAILNNQCEFIVSITVVLLFGVPISIIMTWQLNRILIPYPSSGKKEFWDEVWATPKGGDVIGVCERLIFFVSVWAGAYTLIIAWLVFKTASKWEVWTNITQVPKELSNIDEMEYYLFRARLGSKTHQRFLIGTALNLIASIISVCLFQVLISN